MITRDATATPPVVETEEDQADSTDLRVTAAGEDVTPSGSRQHGGRTGWVHRLLEFKKLLLVFKYESACAHVHSSPLGTTPPDRSCSAGTHATR